MSYDIYLIKRKDLNAKNIDAILEEDALQTDKHFVSKKEMLELKELLAKQGLKFEVFESPDGKDIELNFATYQLSMFPNQFAINVPYWESNSNDGINKEIKIIINTLLENGFTGYDPQTEEFIKSKYDFNKTFVESKTVTEKTQNPNTETETDKNAIYKNMAIGMAVFLIIALIIKFFKK